MKEYQENDEDCNGALQYIQITGEVLQCMGLSSFAKLVFGVIYTRENNTGDRPNLELLAKDLRVTVRAVQRALDELDEFGIIEK